MHKNLLIIVFFCFLQILYSIQNCWEISSEQYCFDGTNSFSDNKYFQVPKEVILQELNQWLIQENEGATKFEIISKNDDENIPRMTKREIVKKEETITKFKLHQTINSDLFEQEIYVHSTNIIQNYKKIQGFEWLSSEAKITLALLHHFYNIESSPFKVWLRALPLKTFPLFSNLSEEAINIVSHEQLAIREIKRIKEKIVDDYKGLTTAIDKLPSEIKVQLLNNRSNITFNDWVVAYFIILKQSWMLFNVRYLVPGANFAEYAINPKIEQEPMAYQSLFSESHIVTHDKSVYFLAENDILHFQNITDNFEVELIDETGFFKFSEEKRKVLSGAGIGNRVCLLNTDSDFNKMEVYGNVLHMKASDVQECYMTLIENPASKQSERIDIILKNCKKRTWAMLENLEDEEFYKIVRKKIENLSSGMNKAEKLGGYEGEMLKFYFEEKLPIAHRLENYLRDLLTKKSNSIKKKKTDL